MVKNILAFAGDIRDVGSVPGSGRSTGGGYGNSLQYSCLENPMDRGSWQATSHGVAQNWTQTEATQHTYRCLGNQNLSGELGLNRQIWGSQITRALYFVLKYLDSILRTMKSILMDFKNKTILMFFQRSL